MSQDGAFLFDQRRFWGDSRVRKMTGEQIALYLKLLSLQWENGDLPIDSDDLACEATEGRRVYTADSLSSGRGALSPLKGDLMFGLDECFQPVEGSPGRMRNGYMHEVRETWRAIQEARSAGGRKGGLKSRKPKKTKAPEGELKVSLSPPRADPEAQRKPNVGKGRKEKGTEEYPEQICSDPAPSGSKPQQEEIPYAGDQAAGAESEGAGAAGDAGVDEGEVLGRVVPGAAAVDLHERLLRICGRASFGGDELRILSGRIDSGQPEMELLWAAKILNRKLKEMSRPIAYLDKAWDSMTGFELFKNTWPADQPFGEPKAAKAWYYSAEARSESATSARKSSPKGEPPDPVIGGLCRWKSSERWRNGFVVSPAQWLEDHSWNDPAPPPAKRGAKPAAEAPVYKEWQPPEAERGLVQ